MERFESKPRVSFEFEVEKVMGISSNGSYLVQLAPAWVNKFYLVGCEHLLQEFLQQQRGRDLELEAKNQFELPDIANETNVGEESEQHTLKQFNMVIKSESELQDELPYLSNDAQEPTQELLEQQYKSQSVLRTVPEDLLKIPDDCNLEKDELSVQLQRNATIGQSTLKSPILETNTANTSQILTANEIHGSTGAKKMLAVKNRIVPFGQCCSKQQDDSALLDVTDEKPSQHICSICHREVLTRHDLEGHASGHINELEVVGSPESNMNDQMDTTAKTFTCSQCGYSCRKKSRLTRHLRSHTGEKPYSCKHCSKSFSQSCNLTVHLGTHTGEKRYACEYCSKTFSQKGNLIKHVRIHTGERPYHCKFCDKGFTRSDTCNQHTMVCLDIAKETAGS